MPVFNYLVFKFKESFSAKAIPSLDGIRAVSCFFVIFGHFSYLYSNFFIEKFGPLWGATITFTFGNQYTGVTFFFVLSGFLITNLLISEINSTGRISIKNFLLKRAFRIFPAYYFYLLVIVLFLYLNEAPPYSSWDVVSALTYVYNYTSDLNPWHMGHFWSLAIEEHFYLLWPLVFMISYKKFDVKLPLLLIALYPLFRIACYYLFPEMRSRMSIMSHTRFDSLLFGCALAYFYKREDFSKINSLIRSYRLHVFSLIHILFLSRLLQQKFTGAYTMTIGYSLDCFAMCIVIIYVVQNKSLLSRALNAPIMVHLGTLSYSLYLWHIPFTWSKLGSEYLILRVVGIYICALISYLLVESPMMDLRKKYFSSCGRVS